MRKRVGMIANIALLCAMLCLYVVLPAHGADPTTTATPTMDIHVNKQADGKTPLPGSPVDAGGNPIGTSNSVWTFTMVWKQSDGIAPSTADGAVMTIHLLDKNNHEVGAPLHVTQNRILDKAGFPAGPFDTGLNHDDKSAKDGMTYKFRVTAGLQMSGMGTFGVDARRIHDEDPTLIYWPTLRAWWGDGSNNPGPLHLKVDVMWGGTAGDPNANPVVPPKDDAPISLPGDKDSTANDRFTIYDSFGPEMIYTTNPAFAATPYGEYEGDSDWDLITSYEEYPNDLTKDPLSTLPPGFVDNPADPLYKFENPEDPMNPDDGTSSTTYTFRVLYRNGANLPPQQYLTTSDFHTEALPWTRGRLWSWDDIWWYGGIDTTAWVTSGVVLYLGVQGANDWTDAPAGYMALPMVKEDPTANDYRSGVVYKFTIGPAWWNWYRSLPTARYTYFFGTTDDYIRDNLSAVPHDSDINPAGWLEKPPYARGDLMEADYSRYITPYPEYLFHNVQNYVDRPTYQPGAPVYYPLLAGQTTPFLSRYTTYYGYQWNNTNNQFTLLSATKHPEVSVGLDGPYLTNVQDDGNLGTVRPIVSMVDPQFGLWVVGATAETELYFQIEYSQVDGIRPELLAGGSGDISVYMADTADMANARRYSLVPTDILGTDPTVGVLYRTSTPVQMNPGPHYYYFTAFDGQRHVKWPVDGLALSPRRLYINNKPVLSNGKVTPNLGTTGDKFNYEVTYTDKDNQRPYAAYVHVKYSDDPSIAPETIQMTKKDPTDNDYTDGVVYYADSSNLHNRLEPGHRSFYFEFVDNWGWRLDPNSRIVGETTYFPGKDAWVDGPQIAVNHRPVLTNGIVMAEDGTSNPATVWSYKVHYTDQDNQSPAFMNLYIGKATKNSSGVITGITWNYGLPMKEANPNDIIYSDGKDYVYSTSLDSIAPGDTYYYAFVASDGIDNAVYDGTPTSASNVIWDPMETISPETSGALIYKTANKPIVGEIPITTTNKIYRYPIVFDSAGTQLNYRPNGTGATDFSVDFVNGTITLAHSPTPSDKRINVQYWFGTKGPTVLEQNTAPSLSGGGVTPNPGGSSDNYVFSVVYKDPDGPAGQAPSFIRVVVDGQPTDMLQAFSGSQDYSQGVRFQATMQLSLGAHHFYFEASDGTKYAIFDANGARSSDNVIGTFAQITGPYVNDRPTLVLGTVFPMGTIAKSQAVTYSVAYTDSSNEAPNIGFPVVYIDNPGEEDRSGTATAMSGTTITTDKTWTPHALKGMPLQFTTGNAAGMIYRIEDNTANTITLFSAIGPVSGSASVPSNFNVSKIAMIKSDLTDNNFTDSVVYQVLIPTLGMLNGQTNTLAIAHTAHFSSETTEIIGSNAQGDVTRKTALRYPTSSEIQGPTIVDTAPAGNRAPTLSGQSVTPTSGRSSDTYDFSVIYTDLDGDPPAADPSRSIAGYMRLVIDSGAGSTEQSYDMTAPVAPNYPGGATMTISLTPLSEGTHRYHFEASDGYFITRLPASASQYFTLSVNKKPTLSLASVTPTSGNTGRPFVYSVKYSDADNNAPSSVKLWIDYAGDPSSGIEIKGNADTASGTSYVNGVVYKYTLPAGQSIGTHRFYFSASDGLDAAANTTEVSQPVIHTNNAPALSLGGVSPASGWDSDTYTYSVTYSDPNGDAPKYVKVYIDGTADSNAAAMTLQGTSPDYVAGAVYTYSVTGLTAGTHTCFFKASDWLQEAATDVSSVPTAVVRPTAGITINSSASPRVGQAMTISGTITPAIAVPLTLKITRPNSASTNVTVHSLANGNYTYSCVPDYVGNWKFKTTWAGSGDYLPSSSDEITVAMGAPALAVNGLAMISLPITPSSGSPEGVLGKDPAFALAEWAAGTNTYKMYSLLPGYRTDIDFPMMAAGQGYWIKTLGPKTITPTGTVNAATFRIPLVAGWNQVGNPFLNQVAWSSLKVLYNGQTVSLATAEANDWVRDYGWFYDSGSGNYKLIDAARDDPSGGPAERYMKPWVGIWFKALVPCSLVVTPSTDNSGPPVTPFATTSMTRATAQPTSGTPAPAGKWQVRLGVAKGSLQGGVFIGKSGSSNERMESPAYIENFVHAYVTDDQGNGIYAEDLRSTLSAGDSWPVKVVADTPGEVVLSWDGLSSVPNGLSLSLQDVKTGAKVQMVQNASYKFTAEENTPRSFRVIVEKK